MASTVRCPPRPPGAPDPIERGKRGNPRAVAGCACGCCPEEKRDPGSPCSGRTPCPRPRQEHLHSRLAGTPLRPLGGPRPAWRLAGCPPDVEPDALCARGAPSLPACPAHASWRHSAALAPAFPKCAVGAPHLLAPVEEALALGPHVEQRPHPLTQLFNCGFARHVLNGARLGAVDGANLDPHLGAGRGGRLRFVSPCAQGAVPRPTRAASPAAPALRGRRANARTSEEDRPDAGPDRRPQLLDHAPAQRS